MDKNNNLDLPILLNNTLDSMNNIVNSSVYWHGGSFSSPLPQLPYMPLHSELWKISAAFQPITAWKGQFNLTVSGIPYILIKIQPIGLKHVFVYLSYF